MSHLIAAIFSLYIGFEIGRYAEFLHSKNHIQRIIDSIPYECLERMK